MPRKMHIIMHTHWDREWYFSKQETQVLLRNHMNEVFEFLDKNPTIKYMLDGQAVMLDDFDEISKDYSKELKRFVKNGQLIVGPWYTQSDMLIPSGESIIRNMFYGMKTAKKFGGKPLMVGYVPDSFGHNANLPLIYRSFGIDKAVFWRGWSPASSKHSEFIWRSFSGATVKALNLSTGYMAAKYLSNDKDILSSQLERILKVSDTYSKSNNRAIMNGHDQMPIQRNILEVLKLAKTLYPSDEIKMSSLEEYLNDLDEKGLEVIEGEMTAAKFGRIHKTIRTTRIDHKIINHNIEKKLSHVLEPLSVIATKHGITYPHGLIEKLYKILFENHAHDSMGGCNSDMVNDAIYERYLEVQNAVDSEIELLLRKLTSNLDKVDSNVIGIYNLMPIKKINQVVSLELITRLPGFKILDSNGKEAKYTLVSQEVISAASIDRQLSEAKNRLEVYKSNVLVKVEQISGLTIEKYSWVELDQKSVIGLKPNVSTIENEKFKIEIEQDNLSLFVKVSNKTYNDFLYLENNSDEGDGYDYSPSKQDKVFNSLKNGSITNVKALTSDLESVLCFDINMKLPSNLRNRHDDKFDIDVTYSVELKLSNFSDFISIKMTNHNKLEDSRFRLIVNIPSLNPSISNDMQFYLVDREHGNHSIIDIAKREEWEEIPVPLESMQNFVNVKSGSNSINVFTNGQKEYEVLENGSIAITLIRSFGMLGREDLLYRPGRASGMKIPVDNSQVKKLLVHEMAITINSAKSFNELLNDHNSKLISHQFRWLVPVNINYSLTKINPQTKFEISNDKVAVSYVGKTDKNELVVRVFNLDKQTQGIKIPSGFKLVNSLFKEIKTSDNLVNIKPNEFITMKGEY